MHLIVYDGELFDFAVTQNLFCLLNGRPFLGGHQIFLGHDLVNQSIHVGFKFHVAVGDNANQLAALTDGHTGDMVFGHQGSRFP